MSELAACSVIAIENHCGMEAEEFYTSIQSAIIGDEFPIQCNYKELSFPKNDKPDQKSKEEEKPIRLEDIPILVPKNGKFVPNPVLTKKALEMLQFERKAFHSRPDPDESDEKFRIKSVRSRNFNDGMFKPVKFDESKLKQVPEPDSPVKIQIFSDNVLKSFGGGVSTNKSTIEVSSHDFLPVFLQGARPIPDASMTFMPTQLHLSTLKNNNAVPSTTAKFSIFKTTTPTTSKWIPWYYETVIYTTPSHRLGSPTPMPIFPHFNPANSLSMPAFGANNFVKIQPPNHQPYQDAFSNQFLIPTSTPGFMQIWHQTPNFLWSKPNSNLPASSSNLFNLSNLKETADYISGAIQAFGNQPAANVIASNLANQTTSSALSRLISTIERVSPKIIENIRSKLDSLGGLK